MGVTYLETVKPEVIRTVALRMMAAARTAPKTRGRDHIVTAVVSGDVKMTLVAHMRLMVDEHRADDFFIRDAANLETADGLILIGVKIQPMYFDTCGLCGWKNCEEKSMHPDFPCVFNTSDLGTAVCSATAVASDERIDNRIMFSVGMAARDLQLLGEDVKIVYGIGLSISGKNIFFDRIPIK